MYWCWPVSQHRQPVWQGTRRHISTGSHPPSSWTSWSSRPGIWWPWLGWTLTRWWCQSTSSSLYTSTNLLKPLWHGIAWCWLVWHSSSNSPHYTWQQGLLRQPAEPPRRWPGQTVHARWWSVSYQQSPCSNKWNQTHQQQQEHWTSSKSWNGSIL